MLSKIKSYSYHSIYQLSLNDFFRKPVVTTFIPICGLPMETVVGQRAWYKWRNPGPFHAPPQKRLKVSTQSSIIQKVLKLKLITYWSTFDDGPVLHNHIGSSTNPDPNHSERGCEHKLVSTRKSEIQYFHNVRGHIEIVIAKMFFIKIRCWHVQQSEFVPPSA